MKHLATSFVLDKTTTGDGIVAAIQILHAMQSSDKSLYELKAGMNKRPQILINVKVTDASAMEHPDVKAALLETQTYLNGDGRVLLRPSGTEPLIRVMVEGSSEQEVTQLANKLADVVAAVAKRG